MLPDATAVTTPLELIVATDVLEEVQVPPVAPEEETCKDCPWQMFCWADSTPAEGLGLTVMVNVPAAPVQVIPALVETGVTDMVVTASVVPLFTALKLAMEPVPLAPRPMAVLLLVQLYEVAVPLKVIAVVALPAQRV